MLQVQLSCESRTPPPASPHCARALAIPMLAATKRPITAQRMVTVGDGACADAVGLRWVVVGMGMDATATGLVCRGSASATNSTLGARVLSIRCCKGWGRLAVVVRSTWSPGLSLDVSSPVPSCGVGPPPQPHPAPSRPSPRRPATFQAKPSRPPPFRSRKRMFFSLTQRTLLSSSWPSG